MSLGFGNNLATNPPWIIQGSEKLKYDNIFESLGPVAGKLPGDKVRPVLLNSKLPVDILGKVWELSDIDQDGFLDKDEFCVAMYLVYRAIEKEPVPTVLPVTLLPPSKRKSQPSPTTATTTSNTDRVLPGAVAVLPPMPSSPVTLQRHPSTSGSLSTASPKHVTNQTVTPSQWLVSPADRTRFSGIFQQQKDPDNFINGTSARNVFVQSGLPQNILAHVWNMCDQQQIGRLNQDQFVIAMHLISQKVKGIDLPTQLTPEMLSGSSHDSGYGDAGSLSDASSGVGDSAAMRELDALNQEIEDLRREKDALTTEIQQKELSIRTTSHEVQELQDTLDRDSSSLAQLECDKAEAHTRLDELEQQRNKLDNMLTDVRSKVQEENETIKSLRAQISAQEASVSQQEVDLRKVRGELAELKKEETQLEQRLEAEKQQQINAEHSVKEAQTEIEKVQGQLLKLQQQQKSVNSNIEQYDKAVAALKSESNEEFAFDLHATATSNVDVSDMFNMNKMLEKVDEVKTGFDKDPFAEQQDPFKNDDPFVESDPFSGADPFAEHSTNPTNTSDPFSGADPFTSSASTAASTLPANDPFKITDSSFGFPSNQQDNETTSDPFAGQDPFVSSDNFDSSKSAFTSDPFANNDVLTQSTSNKSNDAGDNTATDSMFDTGLFAAAFSDTGNNKETPSLFNDVNLFPDSKANSGSTDPWGSAFGGDGTADPGIDPFGGDAFSSDAFGKSFDSLSSDNKAPPRPAKPINMPTSNSSATTSDTQKAPKRNKDKPSKVPSEADQLAWAQEESKRAEDQRLKQQRQEEADLELALALSRQG